MREEPCGIGAAPPIYTWLSLSDGSSLRAVGVGPQGGAAEEWVPIISGGAHAAQSVVHQSPDDVGG